MSADRCSWCGETVEADDGYRATEPAGARQAVFCRLEHVVPWVIQGAHWTAAVDPGGTTAAAQDVEDDACAQCGGPLGDRRVLLVRHRGEHRIRDPFCEVGHLLEWAKAGGRYR